MKKKDSEDMIIELFRLCDSYVHIDDLTEFEKKFAKICKKYKLDLYEIYYGMSFKDMKNTYKRYKK